MRHVRLPEPRPFVEQAFWAGMIILWTWIVLNALVGLAHAGDNGQYAQVDQATRDWFKSLRGNNGNGVLCCDLADGRTLLDPEWECKSETECAVKMDGDWVTVPPEAIIHPKNRPASISFAVVWAWNGRIICFLAGTYI